MVNVNRNQLNQKDLEGLLKQFNHTLSKLDESGTNTFLRELLGKEERLTLAKRFAAILLISEGCTEYKTSRLLKLSPTTTGKIAFGINHGKYVGILALLKKDQKSYLKILKTIDSVLHLGNTLPHRVGLDRYRMLNKISRP